MRVSCVIVAKMLLKFLCKCLHFHLLPSVLHGGVAGNFFAGEKGKKYFESPPRGEGV